MSNKLTFIGSLCAAALGSASIVGAGVLTKVVEGRGVSLSPIPNTTYEKLDVPFVSDDDIKAVTFFSTAKDSNPPRRIHKCLFRVPTDGASGASEVLACNRGPSPDGAVFRIFSDPDINASGVTSWSAVVTGDSNGIYKNNTITEVSVFIGAQASGVTGSLFFTNDATDPDAVPFPAAVTDADAVIFKASVNGAATVAGGFGSIAIDQGIFRCASASQCHTVDTLVKKNDSVPDRAGREFCSFGNVLDASNWGVAFRATTKNDCSNSGESSRSGIFRRRSSDGAITTLALESEASNPSPSAGGTRYSNLNTLFLAINNGGDVAFQSTTSGLQNLTAIFFCPIGSPCQPAAPAQVAVLKDSFADGNRFLDLVGFDMDDAGNIAFRAPIRKSNRTNGDSIYIKHNGGDFEAVAITKQTAVPGEPLSVFFSGFKKVSVSPGGKVAFKATFRNSVPPTKKREGIFLFEP